LDPAWTHGKEYVTVPQAMSFSGQRSTLRIVELTERGTYAVPSVYVLGDLAEEDDVCLLQGLCDLDGVNDAAEWCT
jgi:hypothetical protein